MKNKPTLREELEDKVFDMILPYVVAGAVLLIMLRIRQDFKNKL